MKEFLQKQFNKSMDEFLNEYTSIDNDNQVVDLLKSYLNDNGYDLIDL